MKNPLLSCSGAGLPASEAELQIIERTRLAPKPWAFFWLQKMRTKKPDPCPFTWSFLTHVSGFTSLTLALHLSKIKRYKVPEVDRQKRIFKQMLPPPCDESLGCDRETLIDQHLSLFDLFAQLESELHDSDIQVLSISIYDDSQVIHRNTTFLQFHRGTKFKNAGIFRRASTASRFGRFSCFPPNNIHSQKVWYGGASPAYGGSRVQRVGRSQLGTSQ